MAAVLVAAVVAGCAQRMSARRPGDTSERGWLSASELGGGWDELSAADMLLPEEREALARSQMRLQQVEPIEPPDEQHVEPLAGGRAQVIESLDPDRIQHIEPARPRGAVRRALDTAGKVTLAVLSVGISLGAMIAPLFFL